MPTESRGTRSSNPVPSSGEFAANLGPKRSNGGVSKNTVRDGDRWFESISLQRKVCELPVPIAIVPDGADDHNGAVVERRSVVEHLVRVSGGLQMTGFWRKPDSKFRFHLRGALNFSSGEEAPHRCEWSRNVEVQRP